LSFILNVSQAVSSTAPSRPFDVTFAPIIKGGFAMPDGWALHADLVSPIALTPVQISYQGENRLVAGQEFNAASLQVRDQEPGIELRLKCPPDLGTAVLDEGQGIDEGAGSSKRSIAFSPSDSLGPGLHEDQLEIGLWRSGRQLTTMFVPIVVEVVGLAEVRPRAIDFGFVDASRTATAHTTTAQVLLAPTGGQPVKVIADLGQEADIRIHCPPVLHGEPEWMTIDLLSAEEGRHGGVARVGIAGEDHAAGEVEVIEIPFAYVGTATPIK
jgi:hypothetical protein